MDASGQLLHEDWGIRLARRGAARYHARMRPALHHVAFACRDLDATHRFYQELLGFPLVNTEVQRHGSSWLKHVFYDLGDGSAIAFFDLHGCGEPTPLATAISTDLGLPIWVNHVAFRVDAERQAALRTRLEAGGHPVTVDIDHGWCRSLYFTDPNGILVELCCDTTGLPVDQAEAERRRTTDPDGA